jgi:hypothetical protein
MKYLNFLMPGIVGTSLATLLVWAICAFIAWHPLWFMGLGQLSPMQRISVLTVLGVVWVFAAVILSGAVYAMKEHLERNK